MAKVTAMINVAPIKVLISIVRIPTEFHSSFVVKSRKRMGICLKNAWLSILLIVYIHSANAQADSLSLDSQKVVSNKPRFYKKSIVPAALIVYGTASLGAGALRQFDRYVNNSAIGQHSYSGTADHYLRYGPIVAVYGLDLIGIKAKHNFIDRSTMLLLSMALTSTGVTFIKNNIHRERPDGSSFRSFPSSHTAMAFMAAEFMNQEYGNRSIWYSVIGYGTATATGVLRLYHHVHWFSDVVMGAGYGILTTKLSYLIYPYLKNIFITKMKTEFTLLPSIQAGHIGFVLNVKL